MSRLSGKHLDGFGIINMFSEDFGFASRKTISRTNPDSDKGTYRETDVWEFIPMRAAMLSRFLSPDPGTCPDERSDIGIQAPGLAMSHNRYAYCMNNPFMYTDPDGYNPFLIIGAIFAGNYIINWLDNTINKKMSPNLPYS